MLQRLEISHFRGIERLVVDDLRPVTLFVGRNGVGKSTVLEAAAIAARPDDPDALLELGANRDLPDFSSKVDISVRSLFFHQRTETPICLNYRTSLGDESIEITAAESPLGNGASRSSLRALIHRIEMTHRIGDAEKCNSLEVVKQHPSDYFKREKRDEIESRLGATVLRTRSVFEIGSISQIYFNLLITSKGNRFLNLLRTVRPDVTALNAFTFDTKSLLLVTTEEGTVPANLLGDGFCRIALIAAALFSQDGRLTIVDEIDSGLHRSVMVEFWKQAAILQSQLGFQLLCSTHDEDMLLAAREAFADHPEMLTVIRLEEGTPGCPRAVRYSWDELDYSLESGIDPRG